MLSPSCIMYSFRVPALEIMRLLSSFLVMICIIETSTKSRSAKHVGFVYKTPSKNCHQE